MSKKQDKIREILVVDSERCTGCETCESVCSMVHDDVFNPKNSRIHRIRIEPVVNSCIACLRCTNPDCIDVCQINALEQDSETGTILVKEDLCDGCGSCVRACPFGVITIHSNSKKVISCDLCESTQYDTPQCVRYCPKSAIYVEKINREDLGDPFKAMAQIVNQGFPISEKGELNNMREKYREYT